MTEKPVELSITVNVSGEVIQYMRKIAITELETGISQVMQEIGNRVLVAGLAELDRDLRTQVPAGWRNIGTEERSILSSMGWIRYQRRIYKDEKGGTNAILLTRGVYCYIIESPEKCNKNDIILFSQKKRSWAEIFSALISSLNP